VTKVIAGMTSPSTATSPTATVMRRPLPDLADLRGRAYIGDMIEETGAVIMGRRTFEMAVTVSTRGPASGSASSDSAAA
jgi:hypothetical protein